MITKEKLQERLAKAKADRERLIVSTYVNSGVIGDCEYWLKELEKEDTINEPDITIGGGGYS